MIIGCADETIHCRKLLLVSDLFGDARNHMFILQKKVAFFCSSELDDYIMYLHGACATRTSITLTTIPPHAPGQARHQRAYGPQTSPSVVCDFLEDWLWLSEGFWLA